MFILIYTPYLLHTVVSNLHMQIMLEHFVGFQLWLFKYMYHIVWLLHFHRFEMFKQFSKSMIHNQLSQKKKNRFVYLKKKIANIAFVLKLSDTLRTEDLLS